MLSAIKKSTDLANSRSVSIAIKTSRERNRGSTQGVIGRQN